jgi:hypothetical protein
MDEFDTYDFKCRNIFPKHLNKYYNVDETVRHESWKPPKQCGLSNSQSIIPEYYLTKKCSANKIFSIDYYYTIEDSIKNLRPLTFAQRQYLRENPERQLQIILLYDEVMKKLVDEL